MTIAITNFISYLLVSVIPATLGCLMAIHIEKVRERVQIILN